MIYGQFEGGTILRPAGNMVLFLTKRDLTGETIVCISDDTMKNTAEICVQLLQDAQLLRSMQNF